MTLVLTGADLVLPDSIVPAGTITLTAGLIGSVSAEPSDDPAALALHGCTVVPGFIDVHVHGVDGIDTLDEGEPIAELAARMPRHGVTAFCPTTVACAPDALARVLAQVEHCRGAVAAAARVLPAHLESNFINAEYAGAQPQGCIRTFESAVDDTAPEAPQPPSGHPDAYSSDDVLRVIDRYRDQIAIVTLAPETAGGLQLIEWLRARGVRVALGHSGATYEAAMTAIDRGARHATHLFNRMPPYHHRHPGLVGAVLDRDEVTAEIVCDGVHVHPSLVRMALSLKGTARIVAITDATAAAGRAVGSVASLGGAPITAGNRTALLADGTMAGSVITMDGVFRWLTGALGLSFIDAATICATTPARALGLAGYGIITAGAVGDLTVLDAHRRVARTYVAGQLVYDAGTHRSRPLSV